MTDSDSSPPPAPPPDSPNKPATTPRRIVKTEADHPANAEPEGRDRPSVSQRVFEQRPGQRTPPPAPSPSARPARPAKPDLRDLPPPRRDTPANVWRADPPPAPPRRRDDFQRDDRPRDDARRPDDDRREGPRRAWGDAPRPDRPGERRASPGPRQEQAPRFDFRDRPDDRRPGPPPQGERRRDGPPSDERGAPRQERPRFDDRERPRFDDRDRPRFEDRDRGRPAYGERDHGPSYPQGPNERPRYQGPRGDERAPQGHGADRPRPERGDRRPPGPNDRPPPRRRDDAPREDFAPRPPRPVVDPDAPRREDQRLSKVLAERGIASRREADDWIDAGWVKVDGELAVLGARVFPHQVIEIDEIAKTQQAHRVTILLHKPIGYVSGQAEDGYEPASVLVTQANHWPEDPARERWHAGHGRMLAPAGRLDIDSTGLLVLTQDGRIARHLIGEDSDVEKEYLVRVEYPSGGQFPDDDLQRLRHGLWRSEEHTSELQSLV